MLQLKASSHHCLAHYIAYKGAQYPMLLAITSYCMSFLDVKVSFSLRNNALRNKYAQDHIFHYSVLLPSMNPKTSDY